MIKHLRYVIVGAGIAGCSIARIIAEYLDKINYGMVLLIEKEKNIGGMCYDYYDEYNLYVQKYGGHFVHTNSGQVWNFLSRFTDWNYYQHKVLSYSEGSYHVFPPLFSDIDLDYVSKSQITTNAQDFLYSKIGVKLTDQFYSGYSKKLWGVDLDKLNKEIVEKVELKTNEDPRYYHCKYQGIPSKSFVRMFENMIDHKRIKLLLSTEFCELGALSEDKVYDWYDNIKIIWTGRLDELFRHKYGKLRYRGLDFKYVNYDVEYWQPYTVVNYPNDYDYIRTLELKHATRKCSSKTGVLFETPSQYGIPCYPAIVNEEDRLLCDQYLCNLNEIPNRIYLIGRLAENRYMNISEVLESVFLKSSEIISNESGTSSN